MSYIHEQSDWPGLSWHAARLSPLLAEVRHRQGRLLGRMEGLGFRPRAEASLATLTADVITSSAIEGEHLDVGEVRSSLARRLGMDVAGLKPSSRDVDGVVEMMLDATQHHARKLTVERLWGWHAALFPSGRSGLTRIAVGKWRSAKSGPMRVVSGALGREKVHFEAPAANRLKQEMKRFLDWVATADDIDPVLKAGVGHFWFVTIHPFEDGNGRIGRAIADLLLARADGMAERFYSMSAQIETERKNYYQTLESSQRGTTDITLWLEWFLGCLGRALAGADATLSHTLRKAKLWEKINQQPVNERQRKVINRLVDGFEGKLTSSKYAALTKCSPDTALRDIRALVDRGLLCESEAGGRSTSYTLAPA